MQPFFFRQLKIILISNWGGTILYTEFFSVKNSTPGGGGGTILYMIHLYADFHASPSKEYLILFLFRKQQRQQQDNQDQLYVRPAVKQLVPDPTL